MKITYNKQSDTLRIELSDAQDETWQHIGGRLQVSFAPDGTPRSLEISEAAAHGIAADNLQISVIDNQTPSADETIRRKASRASRRAKRFGRGQE